MDTDEDKEVEDMEVDTDEQTGTVAAGSAETPKKTGKEKKAKAGSAEKSKAAAKPVKKEAEGNTKREGAGRPKKDEAVDNANQTRIVNFLKYQSEKKKTADTCVHLPSLARLLVRRCTIFF